MEICGLNNEENKAIEDLIEEIVILKENSEMIIDSKELLKYKETLLNLIKKQSKEIEELKEKNKPQPDCAESIERTEEMVNMRWVNHNYIRKDKIKAKIEEYEKEIQIRKNVINNDVLDKQTIEKARIEWACMEDFIYEMQSLLEKE